MPQIGERRKGREIGKRNRSRWGNRTKYEWSPCRVCGKCRWVVVRKGKVKNDRCKRCSDRQRVKKLQGKGDKSGGWKGGVFYNYGYKFLWIGEDCKYYKMAIDNHIAEHRLVMAKHLGRCLEKWEVIHHKNGIKDDNRIENLELTNRGQHSRDHNRGYRDGFRKGYLEGKNKAIKEKKDKL